MSKVYWMLTYDAAPRTRILCSRFLGVTHFNCEANLWWADTQKRWCKPVEMIDGESYSNTAPCKSFKAFKRHLRKHPELRGLGEVVLVSRFMGCDIRATSMESPDE